MHDQYVGALDALTASPLVVEHGTTLDESSGLRRAFPHLTIEELNGVLGTARGGRTLYVAAPPTRVRGTYHVFTVQADGNVVTFTPNGTCLIKDTHAGHSLEPFRARACAAFAEASWPNRLVDCDDVGCLVIDLLDHLEPDPDGQPTVRLTITAAVRPASVAELEYGIPDDAQLMASMVAFTTNRVVAMELTCQRPVTRAVSCATCGGAVKNACVRCAASLDANVPEAQRPITLPPRLRCLAQAAGISFSHSTLRAERMQRHSSHPVVVEIDDGDATATALQGDDTVLQGEVNVPQGAEAVLA